MSKEICITKSTRFARFEMVTVSQYTDIATWKVKPTRIGWSSPLPQNTEETTEFIKTLTEAVELAREWDKDTGKNYKEVFGE